MYLKGVKVAPQAPAQRARQGQASEQTPTSTPAPEQAPKGWQATGAPRRSGREQLLAAAQSSVTALGLSSADLQGLSSEVRSRVEAAARQAAGRDIPGALATLKGLKDVPEGQLKRLFGKVVESRLPEGVVKTALQNDKVLGALWQNASTETLTKLQDPQHALSALKTAVQSNPEVLSVVVDEVLKRPNLGLVKKLGPGALDVVDLAQALRRGEPIDPKTPLSPEQAQALVGLVPEGLLGAVSQRFGLTREQLASPPAIEALPAVLSAGAAFAKHDVAGGVSSLLEGAQGKPELVAQLLGKASGRLGPLGPLVSDPEFVKALLADPALRQRTVQALQGKDPVENLKGLWSAVAAASTGNEALRTRFLGHVANALPDQARGLKPLLADEGLRARLASPSSFKALGALVTGSGEGRLQAFGTLAKDPALQSALKGAIAHDVDAQRFATAVGLTPADLLDGRVGEQVLLAGRQLSERDFKSAGTTIAAIAKENPGVSRGLLTTLAQRTNHPTLNALVKHEAMQQHLGSAVVQEQLLSLLAPRPGEEGLASRLKTLGSLAKLPGLDRAVKDAAALDPAVSRLCDSVGLAPQAVFSKEGHFEQAFPHLVALGESLSRQDVKGAVSSVAALGRSVPPEARLALARHVGDRLKRPALSELLSDPQAAEPLKSPQVQEQVARLATTDVGAQLDAMTKLAEVPGLTAAVLSAVGKEPRLAERLNAFGVPPSKLTGLGGLAVPTLKAATLAHQGRWQEGLDELSRGAKSATDVAALKSLVKEAAPTWASKLPADSLVGTLLGDAAVLQSVLEAPGVDAKGVLGGSRAALSAVVAKPEVAARLANAVWKNPRQQQTLSAMGFSRPEDVQGALPALPALFEASTAFAAKDIQKGIAALGPALESLPRGFSVPVSDALLSRLPLGPARDLVGASKDLLNDPGTRRQLLEFTSAVHRKDGVGATRLASDLALAVSAKNPERAVALLNQLGKLPGGMGRFFQNPALNEALVKTDTLQAFLTGGSALARGEVDAALGSFAKMRGLVTSEKGKSEYGAALVQQVMAALPPRVRQEVGVQAGKMAVGAVAGQVPGVGLVSELALLGWEAWTGDSVGVALQAANAAAAGAQTFGVPVNAAVRPITTSISAIRAASKLAQPAQFVSEWMGGS